MQYLRQGSTTLLALLTSSSLLVSSRVFVTGRRSAFVSYSNNYYRHYHQHIFSSVHHQYYHSTYSSQQSPFQLYFAVNKGQESTSNTANNKTVRKRKSSTTLKKKTTTKRKMSKKAAAKNPYKKDDTPSITHAPTSLITNNFDQTRTKLLTLNTPLPRELDAQNDNPCIVYWMMRDCRTIDNWALIFAQNLAIQHRVPLRVVYSLPPPPSEDATEGEDGSPPNPTKMSLTTRHGTFLLDGLKIVSNELSEKHVPFDILCPTSREQVGESIVAYCKKDAMAVVCDMSPLRQYRQWTEQQSVPLFESENIPLYQVDAHNIVPVWQASPKREVGARTLRPKINSVFSKYCTTFPSFNGNDHVKDAEQYMEESASTQHDWNQYKEYLNLDDSISQVNGMQAGHEVAMARFNDFCTSKQNGLKNFDTLRNDPNYSNVCSNLSPWINFGQVSFQRLALDVRALKKHSNGTAAYIEEGVVRRELSDNFVYYTPDAYDSLSGAADWARESLELHSSDEREHLYTWKQLEKSQTHDDLWNAAQLQLVQEGGMHGFLRMYWAKKILEWTSSPAYALATAQYFNDRYAYDGNCPNGFVGVGWSIMGIHDMGWKERPIFGKIRFMNYNGCKRKFKVAQFVARYKGAAENAAKATAKAGGNKKSAFIEQISGKKRKHRYTDISIGNRL